jgi:hypothetical protein
LGSTPCDGAKGQKREGSATGSTRTTDLIGDVLKDALVRRSVQKSTRRHGGDELGQEQALVDARKRLEMHVGGRPCAQGLLALVVTVAHTVLVDDDEELERAEHHGDVEKLCQPLDGRVLVGGYAMDLGVVAELDGGGRDVAHGLLLKELELTISGHGNGAMTRLR